MEDVILFCGGGTCTCSGRVSQDLKLNADEETFNIRALYDIKELYGKGFET